MPTPTSMAALKRSKVLLHVTTKDYTKQQRHDQVCNRWSLRTLPRPQFLQFFPEWSASWLHSVAPRAQEETPIIKGFGAQFIIRSGLQPKKWYSFLAFRAAYYALCCLLLIAVHYNFLCAVQEERLELRREKTKNAGDIL